MGKYLKKFENHTQYEAYANSDAYIRPNVSYCVNEGDIHYNYYPPFFCKLTLNNGDVLEIEGEGELTSAMTVDYSATCVSAEIGNLCTSIGENAFSQGWNKAYPLSSVTIPSSVTSIGQYAFYDCSSLTSVVIPNSVTNIDEWAFGSCSGLTSVTISDGVKSIGLAAFIECNKLTSVTIPNSVTTIDKRTFEGCSGLTNVNIPNTVTSIGDDAFRNCRSLTSVTIPSSVTSISTGAFFACLTSVNIPNNVISIGNAVFNNCSGLISVTIGSGVTSISAYVFANCSSLTNVIVEATTAPTINSYAFQNVKPNGILSVPSGSSGYDVWMQNANYYLGLYGWTKVEQ